MAGPILAALVFLALPEQYVGETGAVVELSEQARAVAAFGVWMAVWWMTEAISLYATALLPLVAFPLSGATTIKQAAAPYGHELIYLFLGGFIIALALERWGLHRRMALTALRAVGTSPWLIIGAFMGIASALSMWVTNTATTIMLLPVAVSIIHLFRTQSAGGGDGHVALAHPATSDQNFPVCLLLGIAYAASIGGIGTIVGTAPNLFVVSFLQNQLGVEISFARWMLIGVPLVLLFVPCVWLLLTRIIYPVSTQPSPGVFQLLQAESLELPPMQRGEKLTLTVFAATALAWVFRPLLNQLQVGNIRPLEGLTDPGIAVLGALILFVLPADSKHRRFVMDWETAVKLPWGLLVLFGGGLSLAAALDASGFSAFLGSRAAALAPFLGLVALSPFMMRKRVDELGSRAREALGELNAHAVDTIQGLAEIVAFQRTSERRAELISRTENHHIVRLPFFRDLTIQTTLLEVATGLGGLAVVVAGARLVDSGRLESGILPLLTLLSMAAFLPISEISNVGRQLADTLGSTRRLYAVDNESVPVTDGKGVPVPKGAVGGLPVVLDAVDFQYEAGNRRALHGAVLVAPAGKTVALVGSSGAGKTTIAHLLMRFWDPENGVIRLGGHDLRDYALDDLRRKLALVAQDTYLFNDTLRANILIANPEADETTLMQALDRASLGDFVSALPDGLETKVGERGMRLSGGQRQRVAIARAFLKDAPVLILDEATSHLDAVNEQAVRKALAELMTDRTTIVIAHRLSTIRNSHKIVTLNEGRVMEAGTHDELLAKGGLYAQLVAHQLAGAAGRTAAE